MIKKIKNIMLSVVTAGALLFPVVVPGVAVAQNTQDKINSGIACGADIKVADNCVVQDPNAESKVESILKLIINLFSVIVGVIAVIMIIVGGVKYITSGGASDKVTGAKNTILFAIVGLVVVALAQIIVRFVLTKVA